MGDFTGNCSPWKGHHMDRYYSLMALLWNAKHCRSLSNANSHGEPLHTLWSQGNVTPLLHGTFLCLCRKYLGNPCSVNKSWGVSFFWGQDYLCCVLFKWNMSASDKVVFMLPQQTHHIIFLPQCLMCFSLCPLLPFPLAYPSYSTQSFFLVLILPLWGS